MTHEQAMKAVKYHLLALLPPTSDKIEKGWMAADLDRKFMGFGDSPVEAVEDYVRNKTNSKDNQKDKS